MARSAERVCRVGLRRVDEGQEPDERETALVLGLDAGEVRGVADSDGDETRAGVELALDGRLGSRRQVRADGEHGLGRSLRDDPASLRRLEEHGHPTPLVVEGGLVEPPPRSGRGGRRPGGAPERLVERAAAGRHAVLEHDVRAGESQRERAVVLGALRPERAPVGDATLGQRAGLVGEEHLDVPEVLDGNEAAHQDRPRRHPLRTRREADRHDGGQQLGRHADRHGEREQDRVDERAPDREVHDQDPDDQDGRDADEQLAEVAEAALEGGLGRALTQQRRDPTELRLGAGPHDDRPSGAGLHHRAHERARGQVDR